MELLDPHSLKKLKEKMKDSQQFIESFLKIRTKEGNLVPFKLNSSQIRLIKTIEAIESEGKPVRILILKARQMG